MSGADDIRRLGGTIIDALSWTEADVAVERVMVEVRVGDRAEVVTLSVRGGDLVAVSSDGASEGAHVGAALRWLARGGDEGSGERRTHPGSISAPPDLERATEPQLVAIADAMDDLLTAVVRVGMDDAAASPSVQEGVERLVRVAPSPMPLGLERWAGRFQSAIQCGDVQLLSRLLEGASRMVGHLRDPRRSVDAARRIAAWLGANVSRRDRNRVHVREFVELGREWLPGLERAAIERRYLADTGSGEVFAEERRRGEPASVGPSPRHLQVGLGEIESESAPSRLHLYQYTVAPLVPERVWTQMGSVASTDFALLGNEYRAALKAFPALAEPFVLVRPNRCEGEGELMPVDAAGHPLPLARSTDPACVEAFERVAARGDVSWIAGRLLDAEGVLLLLPFGVAHPEEGKTRYTRLR